MSSLNGFGDPLSIHCFLVVICAYNVTYVSSFHCLVIDDVFIDVKEALVSFAFLFVAFN